MIRPGGFWKVTSQMESEILFKNTDLHRCDLLIHSYVLEKKTCKRKKKQANCYCTDYRFKEDIILSLPPSH